jgi:hypothetical protein
VITRANAAGGNTVRSSTKIKAAGGYMTMGGYQTVGFTVVCRIHCNFQLSRKVSFLDLVAAS